MTTGKTIALTRWTFVGKVMSLLFNMLSRFVIIFLPRSKHLLIITRKFETSHVGGATRKQSSLSGKESAQGCIPKRLLGRPD